MTTTPSDSHARRQRASVFALLVGAVLVVLLLLGYQHWASYREALREAETKTYNYAAIVESRLDATLRRADAVLQGLAQRIPVESLAPGAAPRFAAGLDASLDRDMINFPEINGFRVFDASGNFLYASGRDRAPPININDRGYFRRLREEPAAGLVFSEARSLPTSRRMGVVAARALRDPQGSFRGVVIAGIDLDPFEKLFESLDIGAGGVLVIRRSDDFRALVRWPVLDSEVNRPLPPGNPVREAMLAGKPQGTIEFAASSDGMVRIYSYRSVAGYPFFVLVAVARADVLAGWRARGIVVGAIAALLLLLVAALLLHMWRTAEREARSTAGLRAGEERLRLATAAGGIGLYDLDVRTGAAIVNDEYARMLCQDPGRFQASNQAWIDRLHPDDRQPTLALYRAFIDGRSATYVAEFRQRAGDGAYRWIQSGGRAVERDAEGRALRILGTHLDITERKRTETTLRKLNARLDFLLSASPVTLYTCQAVPPYAATFISGNLTAMLGYAPELFVDTPGFWADHIHPDDRERVFSGMANLFAHGHHAHEYRFRHRNGSWRFMEDTVRLINDAGGDTVEMIGCFLDVTDRRLAQDARLASEAQYRRIVQTAQEGIWLIDRDDRTRFINPKMAAMLGYSEGEMQGRSPFDFMDEKGIADTRASVARRRGGVHEQYDLGFRHRNGHMVWTMVSTSTVLDENQKYNGTLAMVSDITARKRAEDAVLKLNAALEHRVKARTAELEAANKELETFTYTVSHDLKAPLRGIDGYSNLLLQDYADRLDENALQFLRNVRKAAKKMGELNDDLLAYSRLEQRDLALAQVQSREVIESLLAEYAPEISAQGVAVTVAGDCGTVRADREALAAALRNLLGNALKFSRGVARPEVEIGCGETATAHRLWVRDNGIGFDMEYHDQIFGIFKRLHHGDEYPGTGVGLAIVRKAMARIGGRAWAESAPGRGATFFLEIPK